MKTLSQSQADKISGPRQVSTFEVKAQRLYVKGWARPISKESHCKKIEKEKKNCIINNNGGRQHQLEISFYHQKCIFMIDIFCTDTQRDKTT